ncbi:unnamed protein product [Clavelina lepadiformis]|uniref:Uncharacterized protein n=1 Tax=Clavelina lepadiformis TaxID=159417 RepID=A0ABP0GQH5_CLALP
MTTGRINQVAIRSKRGCCGTTGAPRFFSHVLRVHRYSNTTLAACTSSENRQFRTLPGDSSAILAPRHADSLPLDPTDRSKPRLSMGDRANSITSAHRARRQPRSILLRFALARAFAHTTACSLIVVTESCIAMVPQNGLGIARARGRIWSLGRCVAACRGRRTAPRPGTARNSNVWTLKIFPNVWTLTFCRDLKKFQSPNIDPRQKLFRGRKIRARSREYARPGRLDSNIFWSGWGKIFRVQNTDPARDALPSSENPRQEGQPTRESHLSDSRKVGSRHCQRPNGRLTLPVEDGARVHRRFLGGILT